MRVWKIESTAKGITWGLIVDQGYKQTHNVTKLVRFLNSSGCTAVRLFRFTALDETKGEATKKSQISGSTLPVTFRFET